MSTIKIVRRKITYQVHAGGRRGLKGDDGAPGPAGAQGPQGPPGAAGADGVDGADGVIQSIVAGANVTVDDTDPANPIVSATGGGGGGGAVDSVNGQTGVVVLNQDNVGDGTTYKRYSQTEKTKLSGIATNATANDTDANLRNRANHTGTQTASTISDFDTEVSNNTDVSANTVARHTHSNKSTLDATTASFTTTKDSKLSGIEAGAEVNVQSDWNAGSGDAQILNKPTIPNSLDDLSGNSDDITEGSTNLYLTSAERTKLSNTSGTNTGDQTLSGLGGVPTSRTINGQDLSTNRTLTQDNIGDGTTYKQYSQTEKTKLSGIETGADVTDSTNVEAAGAVMNSDTSTASMNFVVDEDDMISNSATKVPSQQSTKAYTDNSLQVPKNPQGVGLTSSSYLNDWFAAYSNYKNQIVRVVVIGDSITGSIFDSATLGINSDTRRLPGTYLERLLNRGRYLNGIEAPGWIYALGNSDTPTMTGTGSNPSPLSSWGTGGWGSELDPGEYASITAWKTGFSVIYSKHPNGGTMQIRNGGAGGTVLATINTADATTKSGFEWNSGLLSYANTEIYISNTGGSGTTVRLDAIHAQTLTQANGVRVYHAAHGGWTTAGFTANPATYLDLIENVNPDLIIVATGTNDDTANIQSRLEAMYDSIRTVSSKPIIQWIPPTSTGFDSLDEVPAKTACANKGVMWVDSNFWYGAYNRGDSVGTSPLSHDSLHPNINGRRAFAEHLYAILSGDRIGALGSIVARKASIEDPVFSRNVHVANNVNIGGALNIANGNINVNNLFNYLQFAFSVTGDTHARIGFSSSAFNNLLYGINYDGMTLSTGNANPDTGIFRHSANRAMILGGLTATRVDPRVGTVASSATPTINTNNVDVFTITALATNITSMTTNLSGTPTDGQRLWIAITGTAARTISWGASFEASTVALPTTTVTTNRLDCEFIWNAATSKWRIVRSV